MKRVASAAGLFILLSAAAATAQPRFVNAQLQQQAAGASLARTFSGLAAAQRSPGWIGYAVPAVPGEHHMCESDRYPARVYLEGHPAGWRDEQRARDAQVTHDIAILFRADAGAVKKLRVFATDCELDAGGLPVTWLTGVTGPDSVGLLRGFVGAGKDGAQRLQESALTAIALHRDPSALQALQAFVSSEQPTALRKRAAFWLGSSRGDEGFETLRRLVTSEKDAAFRRELVFPISLSHQPQSADLLIRLAHEDDSPEVRKQAMFWLGNKAGERVVSTLGSAADNDPDTAVKRQAVFGLSRMPNGEGVPRLIEVARTNKNPEVRKQAMFWLGHSSDPRALSFLEEFLKKQ